MPLMTTPVLWSSPSRGHSCDDNPRPKASLKRNMNDLDNRIFGEDALGWTADQGWQERLHHQSKYTKTSLQDRLLLAGQGSRLSVEENSRTNFQTPVGFQYHLMAPKKTSCQDYFARSGATAGDEARDQTLISHRLSEENANTSFYARILEATPPSSSSSALQLMSENNYSQTSLTPAVYTNRHLHLGLHNNKPVDASNSQGIHTNFSPPLFLQSNVEPLRHQMEKHKTPYGTKFSRHRGESFSGGTVIPAWDKRFTYNSSRELSSIPRHSRSLSTPEVFHSAGRKSEQENRPETFPNTVPEASANFLLQSSFVTETIPSVTVVLEGRSICQRICLQEHSDYDTFAQALRGMFADSILTDDQKINPADDCNLTNAIPDHLIAYEDIEGDILLAGDLSWKDFVRAAKRIRIVPAKNPQGRLCEREE